MGEIKQITERINKFRDERDWMQFHHPKKCAMTPLRKTGLSKGVKGLTLN